MTIGGHGFELEGEIKQFFKGGSWESLREGGVSSGPLGGLKKKFGALRHK